MNTDFIIPGKAEELATSFEDQAQEMLISYTMLSDEAKALYVITVADLPLQIVDGKATWVPLRQASRFSNQQLALHSAARVRNGNGDRGHVVTLGGAYMQAIVHLKDLAAKLRAANA